MKEPYVSRVYWNKGQTLKGEKWYVRQEHRPNGRGGKRTIPIYKKFKTKAEAIKYRNKHVKPKLIKINLESGKHKCRVCQKVKPIDKFKKQKSNISNGIEGICKECHNNISRKNYNATEQQTKYMKQQQELTGCERIIQIMKRTRTDEQKTKRTEKDRYDMETNPFYRAEKYLANALRQIANDCKKMEGCTELITFKEKILGSYVLVGRLYNQETPQEFRLNLKRVIGKNSRGTRIFKFTNGQRLTFDTITWLDYKNRKEPYELDHIIPRKYWIDRINASDDLDETLELLIMCCNYRNVQILTHTENQMKSDKIDERRLNNYLSWWKRNSILMNKYKEELLEKCQDERQQWLLNLVKTIEYGTNMHPRQVEIGNG